MNNDLLKFGEFSPNKKTLVCFSFAGSGANYYRHWSKEITDLLNVVAVQLPGRENRINEKCSTDFVTMAERLASTIDELIIGEFSIFGHSLGAILGFAVCQILQKKYGRHAQAIFISGRRPPGNEPEQIRNIKNDTDAINFFKNTGGAPSYILNDNALMKMYLPIIRADLDLNLNSAHFDFNRLDCPMITFSGENDILASPADMALWYKYTSQECSSYSYPGGHFFLGDFAKAIHEVIVDYLEIHEMNLSPS